MTKRLSLFAVMIAVSVFLSSCGSVSTTGGKASGKGKTYTNMIETDSLDELKDKAILGISPDGKNVIVSASDGLSIINLEDREVKETLDSEEAAIGAKTALWSKDGDHFILGDASYIGNELKMMKCFNLSAYTLKDERRITDLNVEERFMKGGELLYAPTWSADGKGVIYSCASLDDIKIIKVDIKSQKETVLYQTEDRSGFEQAIELKNGLLLCEFNGAKIGDNRIFLYDVKKDDKKDIEGILEDNGEEGDKIPFFYEIKGWSDDRRTVLINKLAYGQYIHKSFILRFDESFKTYDIEALEYQLLGQDRNLVVMNDKAEKRLAYSTLLSRDGRYLISREDEILESEGPAILKSSRQLVLHDLAKDKDYILYQTEEEVLFGILSPLNKNSAPLFLTDDGLLMVWFLDGYKLFQLKP